MMFSCISSRSAFWLEASRLKHPDPKTPEDFKIIAYQVSVKQVGTTLNKGRIRFAHHPATVIWDTAE